MPFISSPFAFRHDRRRVLGAISAVVLAAGTLLTSAVHADQAPLDTAFGPVTVKPNPQRIITLDEGALDSVLALGMTPVGSVAARGGTQLPAYLQPLAANTAIVGTTREPSLEAILAQRPDLILAPPGLEKRVYDVLSKMAPTIVPTTSSTAAWRGRNDLYVKALGKQAEMRALLEAFDARAAGIRERMPAAASASVVRWNPQGPLAMSAQMIAGQILTELGLRSTQVASELGERPHSDILSLENLGSIDADWLFIATLNEQGEATLAAARQQPAFNRLNAVRNGRAVSVDGQVWTSSTGVLAANRILDDIETLLLK